MGALGERPVPPGALEELCRLTSIVLGASATSLARVEEAGIRYVASVGPGADLIVGVEVAAGAGLGNFVAATGETVVVDDVGDDPRFDRATAERTGYVPSSMLLAPVEAASGDVVGVLTALDPHPDRSVGDGGVRQALEALVTIAGALLER